ncbi:MAG: DEAD/DEAH box helicase, partial [Xanthomonadales bacterium]|nr:DEAD/DEAH box helicase [Xanthomonadales bacterium]
RALILTPTRELAAQVHESLCQYGRHLGLRSAVVVGGVSLRPQIAALRGGLDILVATPGRLIDHLQQRSVSLSEVHTLVLDEADRMLDMGFLPSLKQILARLPAQRQSLLFSATFGDEIVQLAQAFLRDPEQLQITPRNSAAATISHQVHPVDAGRKRDLLLHLLAEDSRRQTLVFARTKHGSDKLVRFLDKAGLRCAAIHGNKSQGARTRALDDFKRGRINVLVATDIAARGLDIAELPIVINFELPMVAEDYVHRIGRTGRNGHSGRAISLVCAEESDRLRAIQRLLPAALAIEDVAGFETTEPLRLQANGGHGGRGRAGGNAQRASARPGGASAAAPKGPRGPGRPGGHRRGRGGRPGQPGAGRDPQAASRRPAPRSSAT